MLFRSGGALAVGASDTFTYSCGSTWESAISCAAFSGTLTTSDPYDTPNQNGNNGTGWVSSIQPGSTTPSQNNSLVLSAVGAYGGSTLTINVGFTPYVYTSGSGNDPWAGLAWLPQSTIAAVNPTWLAGGVDELSASIASFKTH